MNDTKSKVVLQRVGDTAPVTIDQDKCVIRTRKENRLIDCCAIFNGPHGTALRSYTDHVLVNGEPSVASWLHSGDEIELPCSTKLQIKSATQYRQVEVLNALPASDAIPHNVGVPVEVMSAAPANTSMSEALNRVFGNSEPAVAQSEAAPVAVAGDSLPADPYAHEDREEVFHSPFSNDLPSATFESEVSAPDSFGADSDSQQAEHESNKPAVAVEEVPDPASSLAADISSLFATKAATPETESEPGNTEIGKASATTEFESTSTDATAQPFPPSNTDSQEKSVEIQSVMERLGVLSSPAVDPVQPQQAPEQFQHGDPTSFVEEDADSNADSNADASPASDAETPFSDDRFLPIESESFPAATSEQRISQPDPSEPAPSAEETFDSQSGDIETRLETQRFEPTIEEPLKTTSVMQDLEPAPAETPAEPTFSESQLFDAFSERQTTVEESTAEAPSPGSDSADPLSALPSELRDQLSDLVSSLDLPTETDQTPQQAIEQTAAPEESDQPPNNGSFSDLWNADSKPDESIDTASESSSQQALSEESQIRSQPTIALETELQSVQQQALEPGQTLLFEPQDDNAATTATSTPHSESTEQDTDLSARIDRILMQPESNDGPTTDESFDDESTTTVEEPIDSSDLEERSASDLPTEDESLAKIEKPVQQSVAEILGNMGMAIPGVEESDASGSMAGAVEPSPKTDTALTQAQPEPATVQPEIASTPAQEVTTGGSTDDDIQAYMDRLLNRSSEPKQENPSEPVAAVKVETPVAPKPAEPEPVTVMSPEEFVPAQRASRHESFEDLREIANCSSRNAIRDSSSKALTESIMVKALLFILSFAGALLSYQLQMAIPAIAFAGAAFATSYLFYQDYRKRECGGNSPGKSKRRDTLKRMT